MKAETKSQRAIIAKRRGTLSEFASPRRDRNKHRIRLQLSTSSNQVTQVFPEKNCQQARITSVNSNSKIRMEIPVLLNNQEFNRFSPKDGQGRPKLFPNSTCYESATRNALQLNGACYLDTSVSNSMHSLPFNVTTSPLNLIGLRLIGKLGLATLTTAK